MTAQASVDPDFRYRAFVSYSHQDESWARWLHRALETYVIPRRLVGRVTPFGPIPRRLAPIFRDSDELASAGDLGGKVNEALAQSASLLVVCSPSAAISRWVNEEVRAFKRLGRSERIYCLIVAGEPNASLMPGHEDSECFAPALRQRWSLDGTVQDEPIEPIAADVRPGKDSKADAKYRLIAGMLGIELDALKRREYQRRARRAFVLAGVALLVMSITTALAIAALVARHAAVTASHVAERRQKEAEDLVAFMLGDLNDKLAEVSRLDIMEAVDDQAMNYFQAQPTAEVSDRALAQRVRALESIGSVRLDQGRLAAAMASYQAALPLASRLANETPANTERQLALAEVHAFIGIVHWQQGSLDHAQSSFTSAQAILQRTSTRAPDDLDLMAQLAVIDNNIGNVMEARGRLDDADAQYRGMLGLMQRLVGAEPNSVPWAESLGTAYNNLGRLALLRGDLTDAVAKYSADEAIQARLAAANPKDATRRDNLLTVHAILGRTQALAGDIAPGMDRLQRAVEMVTQLATLDPSNADFQDRLALYSTQLARLRRLSGDLPAANRLTTRAIVVFARLTQQDADNAVWRREYAEALIERAAQARAVADMASAYQQAQKAVHLLGPLLARQPDDRTILLATMDARLALAAATTAHDDAHRLREEALSIATSAKHGQSDPRLLALQVEALLAMGREEEATPLIERLWTAGYRDAALLTILRNRRIDYPLNEPLQRQPIAANGGQSDR